ncbi:hypothetical protein [Pseudomonas sp. LS.1a]|uniref:hypothetical protein n=1 Tax=Pseudomonas sp. LS.1a TaxID=2920387 RepID=UPI001F136CF4|nr:hypothetical protein [Pseudomonas sp. LS.1a]UMY63900.1 hypothetical protein MKK04_11970 [Pseudomonas sp. LS.1a]
MEAALPGGGYVDVRGRRIDSGEVQLFIGVYTAEGKPVHEEYQEDVKGLTIEQAINDGIKRGQEIAAGATS